jgi:hypothetical protein
MGLFGFIIPLILGVSELIWFMKETNFLNKVRGD